VVPYFTAVLARDGDKWFPRNVDVEALESLDELADALRAREVGDAEPVLAFIEREDSWWAVVRVDGDEDPRVFVSDLAGAAASTYSDMLEVEIDEDVGASTGGYAGDVDLLADLGTSPEDLQEMCEDEMLPVDALAAVAEAGGFAEVLDSLR
jgi:putative tRNA adenosine deaminase-associated protein